MKSGRVTYFVQKMDLERKIILTVELHTNFFSDPN